jgi:hypothetical protein
MSNSPGIGQRKKGLYALAMANAGIWAIAMVALVVLLESGGSIKGMFVILAAGAAVAIQIIASIAKLDS